MSAGGEKLRLDKWLWHARFFKTRSLAARHVSDGHVRVNGQRAAKPSHTVQVSDVLTFTQGTRVRVVKVADLGQRRGPAPEAQALYDDLTPPEEARDPSRAGPRPTKRDRRAIDALRDGES